MCHWIFLHPPCFIHPFFTLASSSFFFTCFIHLFFLFHVLFTLSLSFVFHSLFLQSISFSLSLSFMFHSLFLHSPSVLSWFHFTLSLFLSLFLYPPCFIYFCFTLFYSSLFFIFPSLFLYPPCFIYFSFIFSLFALSPCFLNPWASMFH